MKARPFIQGAALVWVSLLLFPWQIAGQPSQPTGLIDQWTFNDGTANDWIGRSHGALYNGAGIANGQLLLNGVNQYFRSLPITETVTNKTLVVWMALGNLTQQGGSAITLEDPSASDVFDALQFGASFGAARWFNNSDSFRRTPTNSVSGYPVETSTNELMLAAVFGDGGSTNITLYRNGALYASYSSSNSPASFTNVIADVLLGLRDNNQSGNSSAFLAGNIDEARVYDTALNAAAVGALYTNGPVAGLPLSTGGPGYAFNVNPAKTNYVPIFAWPPVSADGVTWSNYTISVWIYLRAGGNTNSKVGVTTAYFNAYGCGSSADFLIHSLTANSSDPQYLELGRCGAFVGVTSTNPVPLRQWTQVAVTVNSTNNLVSYYINGQPAGAWVATGKDTSVRDYVVLADNEFYRYDGLVDEYQFWQTPLTAAQIASNWNLSLPQNTNLVCYIKFDDQSYTPKDYSGYVGRGYASSAQIWAGNTGLDYAPVFVPSGVAPFTPAAAIGSFVSLSTNSASVTGIINPEGTNTIGWLTWDSTTNLGNTTPAQPFGSGTANTNFSQTVSNLADGTLYYAAVIASNSLGMVTSSITPFFAAGPVLVSASVSGVGYTAVTFNGTVYTNGPTTAWFQYGPTTAYGTTTAPVVLSGASNPISFSTPVANLTQGTTYHWQMVVTNAFASFTSPDAVFTTPFVPAAVVTLPNGPPTTTTVVLYGTVNPEGTPAQAWFQWGGTTSYGNSTTPASLGSGTTNLPISAPLSGLTPHTFYHYRAVGTNSAGTFYGADQMFYTLANWPVTNLVDGAAGSLKYIVYNDVYAGDTITISVAGTNVYTGGPLVISSNLTILGPGPSQYAVSGARAYPLFEIAPGATVTMSGLTLRDGYNNQAGYNENGGAVIVDGLATLTLSNCVITGNSTGPGATGQNGNNGGDGVGDANPPGNGYGGGLGGSGGGFFNYGTLNLISCTVSTNQAGTGGTGGSGGSGLWVYSGCSCYESAPGGNGGLGGTGGSGGGIYNLGNLSLIGCTFLGNLAGTGGHGGTGGPGAADTIHAIYSIGGTGGFGGAGGYGGAIFNAGGVVSLLDCTFYGNAGGTGGPGGTGGNGYPSGYGGNGGTGGQGGAVFNSATFSLTASTISGNVSGTRGGYGNGGPNIGGGAGGSGNFGSAGIGGGLGNQLSANALLRSSLIAQNSSLAGPAADLLGAFGSQGHNLIGQVDYAGGLSGSGTADLIGTTATPISPFLLPLANNGGLTLTLAIQPGSPALDAGDDSVTSLVATDQRGQPRLSGAHVDIGAFELNVSGFPAPAIATNASVTVSNNFTNGISSATFVSSVNPGGLPTIEYLQYGVTTNYGNTTPPVSAGYATTNVPVSLILPALPPGLTYHYRLVISSGAATVYGPDQTFTTTAAGDLNGDGKVDLNELNQVIQSYRNLH